MVFWQLLIICTIITKQRQSSIARKIHRSCVFIFLFLSCSPVFIMEIITGLIDKQRKESGNIHRGNLALPGRLQKGKARVPFRSPGPGWGPGWAGMYSTLRGSH